MVRRELEAQQFGFLRRSQSMPALDHKFFPEVSRARAFPALPSTPRAAHVCVNTRRGGASHLWGGLRVAEIIRAAFADRLYACEPKNRRDFYLKSPGNI